jgi:hypothetical protein
LGGSKLEQRRSSRREGWAELKGSEIAEIRRVEAGGDGVSNCGGRR